VTGARRLAAALAFAGILLFGRGLWIPAKALLAQHLLERAFAHARAEAGGADRPWPWADFVPLARLSAPRVGASAVVVSSATGEALAFGPGHLSASAPPGGPGNVVIAGHRDTHFRFLRDLAPGDLLLLETPRADPVAYRVAGARVAHERETGLLASWSGEALLTLVTCWPFDAIAPGGPWRFVVVAVPVGDEPPEEEARPHAAVASLR
jgi:sortase A